MRIKERDGLDIHYNPGGYLGTMMFLFVLMIMICFSLLYVALAQIWMQFASTFPEHHLFWNFTLALFNLLVAVFVVGASLAVVAALKNISSRIRTLESGLLSIHSIAILWEAIVLGHLRALEELYFFDDAYPKKAMHGYTKAIAQQADEMSKRATKIHEWIEDVRRELNKMLEEKRARKNSSPPP
jgi:hypothetical protein